MKYVYIILIFFLQSCERKESNYIFEQNPISNLYKVKIKDVVDYERQLNSFERKNATVDYKLAIAFKYSMETLNRKVFNRKDSNLYVETDYYYDKNDSTLRFLINTWRIKNDFSKSNFEKTKNQIDYNIIKQKYLELYKSFSTELGSASKKLYFKKNVALWETRKADVFITIIDEETENPGIYLFIKTKNNSPQQS